MGYILDNLPSFAQNFLSNVVQNDFVLGFIFFTVIFLGTYAIFKGLLRFFFKNANQFQTKETNTIAVMFSIMSTGGIFFMFKDNGIPFIITLFGGYAAFLLVIFFSIVVMKFFLEAANNHKEKGVAWWFYFLSGLLFSIGAISSYLVFWMKKLGNNVPNHIEVIYNLLGDALTLIVIGLIIAAALFLGKLGKGKEEKEKDPKKQEVKDIRNLLKMIAQELNETNSHIQNKMNMLNSFVNSNDKGESIISKIINKTSSTGKAFVKNDKDFYIKGGWDKEDHNQNTRRMF